MAIFLGQFCPRGGGGGRSKEVNPMWSTNAWDKTRPQHRELRALLWRMLRPKLLFNTQPLIIFIVYYPGTSSAYAKMRLLSLNETKT